MTRDPDLAHHFSPTARPGPEEPWRTFRSLQLTARERASLIAGRADWLANLDLDEVYAAQHQSYRAGYEAEVLDCLDAVAKL